jgi:hypothetical protein
MGVLSGKLTYKENALSIKLILNISLFKEISYRFFVDIIQRIKQYLE